MRIFYLLFLFALPGMAMAQAITINQIPRLAFCAGDTLMVSYTTTGSFASDNHFFVELSDASGSFTPFVTVGSNTAASGVIAVPLTTAGSDFRVKVASADPYTISPENDSAIGVFLRPNPNYYVLDQWGNEYYANTLILMPFDTAHFFDVDTEATGSIYSWSFSADASIPTSLSPTPSVCWASPGIKMMTLAMHSPGGCSDTVIYPMTVTSCTPTIPRTAHIVTGSEYGSYDTVWVKSGGQYHSQGASTLIAFVESGGSLDAGMDWCVCYAKPGASVIADRPWAGGNTLIADSSIVTPRSYYKLVCNSLTFDYSQVTPSSVAAHVLPAIKVHQYEDHLYVNAAGELLQLRIVNILGEQVLSQKGSNDLNVDLSPLAPAVYFAVVQAGGQQEIQQVIR